MLTRTLRNLERDGLVKRTVYPVVPPRVEYALTPLGQTLSELLKEICTWAETHFAEIEAARVDEIVEPASVKTPFLRISVLFHHAEREVRGPRGLQRAEVFQVNRLCAQVIEEAHALTQQHIGHGHMKLVEQPRLQGLLDGAGTMQGHIFLACEFLCFLHLGESFLASPERIEKVCTPPVSACVAGVELEGPPEFLLRPHPVPVVHEQDSARQALCPIITAPVSLSVSPTISCNCSMALPIQAKSSEGSPCLSAIKPSRETDKPNKTFPMVFSLYVKLKPRPSFVAVEKREERAHDLWSASFIVCHAATSTHKQLEKTNSLSAHPSNPSTPAGRCAGAC